PAGAGGVEPGGVGAGSGVPPSAVVGSGSVGVGSGSAVAVVPSAGAVTSGGRTSSTAPMALPRSPLSAVLLVPEVSGRPSTIPLGPLTSPGGGSVRVGRPVRGGSVAQEDRKSVV